MQREHQCEARRKKQGEHSLVEILTLSFFEFVHYRSPR